MSDHEVLTLCLGFLAGFAAAPFIRLGARRWRRWRRGRR